MSRPSAVRLRLAGDERLIAAEDAGRYRDALGAMPPAGLPDAFLEGGNEPLGWILRRFARGRGPFTTAEVASRYGLSSDDAEERLIELGLVRGELRPGDVHRVRADGETALERTPYFAPSSATTRERPRTALLAAL